jgi:hypothetical protein
MLGAGVAHSVWCLATDWTTGRSRFDPWQRQNDFSSRLCPQTSSGAHQASCSMGTGGPFPGHKVRSRRDADHSPPSSAELYLLPQASMVCSGTALLFMFQCFPTFFGLCILRLKFTVFNVKLSTENVLSCTNSVVINSLKHKPGYKKMFPEEKRGEFRRRAEGGARRERLRTTSPTASRARRPNNTS